MFGKGINRGIFGIPSAKKSEIEGLVKLLETRNPTPEPTLFLEKVKSIEVLNLQKLEFISAVDNSKHCFFFFSFCELVRWVDAGSLFTVQ